MAIRNGAILVALDNAGKRYGVEIDVVIRYRGSYELSERQYESI